MERISSVRQGAHQGSQRRRHGRMDGHQLENPAGKMEAERLLAAIVESAEDAIISKDLDGVINSWNKGAEKMFGYTAKEALGKSIMMILPPERRGEEKHVLDKIARGERIEHLRTLRLRKDGTVVNVAISVSPVHGNHGEIVGGSTIAHNIEGEVQAQRRLEQNLANSELLAEAAHLLLETTDPLLILDRFYDRLSTHFGIDLYFHFSFVRADDRFELRAVRGVPADVAEQVERILHEKFCGLHANEVQPIIIPKVEESQEQIGLVVKGLGMTGYVCFPLISQGRLMGRLSLGTRGRVVFTPDLIETLGTLADIVATALAREEADRAMRASEELFHALAENISQLTCITDEARSVVWFNRRWLEYVGGQEFIQGFGWKEMIHPDHLRGLLERWDQAVAETQPLEETIPLRGKDGQYRWFLVRGAPLNNPAGRGGTRWFLTATDITPQRETEERLTQQARLLDLSFDAILVRDPQDRITFWNRAAEELYGWKATEALGQVSHSLLKTVFSEPLEKIEAQLRQTSRWAGELVHTKRDGALMTVSSRWVQDWDANGNSSRVLETNNDVSARRRAEAELRTAREQLAQRAKALEQAVHERTHDLQTTVGELEEVSYSLSHDLRAPLRTIQSFCQIVLREAEKHLQPLEKDLLQRSIGAASRLDRLIRDVLLFNRVSRDAAPLGNVDADRLLRQIIAERAELQPPRAHVEILGSIPPVRAHEAYLTQCITNLLDNAVKFVAPARPPYVRVWSEATDGWVQIWFEDNGIGIPKEALGRVFGMFQRVNPKDLYEGTGIGLAIVKRAAERMEGSVGVESEPGKGSRFWLKLQSMEKRHDDKSGDDPLR